MMLCGPVQLPQDVVDIIVDMIASQKERSHLWKDTLHTCALVSSSFHVAAHKHIFADIELVLSSRPSSRNRADRLRKILEDPSNVHLFQGIRSLRLRFDLGPGEGKSTILGFKRLWHASNAVKTSALDTAVKWGIHQKHQKKHGIRLLELLSQAPGIHTLTVEATPGYLVWEENTEAGGCPAVIRQFCRKSSIQRLRFINILAVDPRLTVEDSVGKPRQLKELVLLSHNFNFHNYTPNVVPAAPSHPSLSGIETLELDETSLSELLALARGLTRAASALMPVVFFPKLKHLCIPHPSERRHRPAQDWRDVNFIIDSVRGSLQSLHLRHTKDVPFLNLSSLRLRELPQLSHLQFTNGTYVFDSTEICTARNNPVLLADIAAYFSTLASEGHTLTIQRLTLNFISTSLSGHLPFGEWDSWEDLDRALVGPSLPMLNDVSLNATYPVITQETRASGIDVTKGLQDPFLKVMPFVASSNISLDTNVDVKDRLPEWFRVHASGTDIFLR